MKKFLQGFLLAFIDKTACAVNFSNFLKNGLGGPVDPRGERITIFPPIEKKNLLTDFSKKYTLKLVLASCLLFLGFLNANAALTVTAYATAGNNGLATSPLTTTQPGISLFGFSVRATGTAATLTSFTFTATQNIATYFPGTLTLYSSTSATFNTTNGTTTAIATLTAPSSTTATFTFATQTIATGAANTTYYYIGLNYTPGAAASFQFELTSITNAGTAAAYTDAGYNYSLNPTLVTLNSLTATAGSNGLSATPVPAASTNYSVFGFQLLGSGGTGTGTINSMTFYENGTSTSNNNTYYTTAYLYSSTSSTYVPGTTNVAGNLVSTVASNASYTITFPTTNISVSNTTNMYYFIVLSNSLANTTANTFALEYTSCTYTTTGITAGSVQGPYYTFAAPLPVTVTATSLNTATNPATPTAGLTANPIAATGAKLPIYGLQLTPSATGATTSITALNFTSATVPTEFNNYFIANAYLYSSTTASYSAGTSTLIKTITGVGATNTLNFTGLNIPITAGGANLYYFVLVDYTTPVAAAATWQLNFTSSSGVVSSGTPAGYNYNFSALTITATSLNTSTNPTQPTAGLTANPIAATATGLPIYGLQLTATGTGPTQTITALNFTAATVPTENNNYFIANAYLYSSTSPTYTAGTSTLVSTLSGVGATTTLNFTTLNIPVAAGATLYYFVLVDYTTPVAAAATWQLNLASVSGATVTGTPAGYNYNFSAITITATSLNTSTNPTQPTAGLTANPISATGSGLPIYGLQLTATGTGPAKTITALNFTAATVPTENNNYFIANAYLYSSTSATYSAGTSTLVSTISGVGATTTLNFTGLSIAVTGGSTLYYFVLVDYTTPVVGAATWQLNLASVTGATVSGTPQGYNYNFSALTITAASIGSNVTPTDGLITSPVNSVQSYGAIYGLSLTPSGTGPAQTITGLSFTATSTQNDSYFYTTAYLYSSTSPTFPGGTPIASVATGANKVISFTGFSNTISGTTPLYYFIAINYPAPGVTATASQTLALTSITGCTFTGTTTGNTYSFQPIASVTVSDIVAPDLTASPIYQTQTGLAVAGMSFVSNTAVTLSQITFSISPAYTGTFTNVQLVTSTNPYGTPTVVSTTGNVITGTSVTFNLTTPATIGTTTTYYYLSVDFNGGSPVTLPATFDFAPTGYTTSFTGAVTTSYAANVYTCYGPPSFSYSPVATYPEGVAMTLDPAPISANPVSAVSYGPAVALTASTGAANLNKPWGMSFDASGNLYAVNYGTGTVFKYTAGGGTPTDFITGLTNPTGIVFDSSGNIYISQVNGDVYKYSSTGTGKTLVVNAPASAYGMCIDASNNIYIADYTGGYIYEYSTTTATTTIAVYVDDIAGGYPTGVAVDAAGNIYTLDYTNGQIEEWIPTFDFSTYTAVVTGLTKPYGLTRDVDGNFYVGDPSLAAEFIYNSSGTFLVDITTGLTSPRGAAVDGSGNLYVSDYSNNAIYKYLLTGGYRINFASGTTSLPPGLTFDTSTGNFAGLPTAVFSGTYTVIGSNPAGSYTCGAFTINCTANAPNIAYTPNTYTLPINAAAPNTIIPANTGSLITTGFFYSAPVSIIGAANVDEPWGMAIDPSGNVYAVNYGSAKVTKYTPAGGISTFATITKPKGIAFDAAGNAYVVSANSLAVYNTSDVLQSTTFTGIANATGIVYYGGNIYVSSSSGTITEYATTGGAGTVVVNATSQGYGIGGGFSIDNSGNFWVGYSTYIYEYNSAGNFVTAYNLGSTVYGVYLDNGGNILVAGNNYFYEVNLPSLTEYEAIGYFTSIRGVVEDQSGNIYVADYGGNAVYEFKPSDGYFLTGGTLPPGLSFNNTTGQITGTPTVNFPATTYTVQGVNAYGTSTTYVTISCYTSYDWIGATSNTWSTITNWESQIVPVTNTASIGVNFAFNYQPTVTANASVAAIAIGNSGGKAATLSANSGVTLTVTGDITKQSDANSLQSYATGSGLAGLGTINAVNVKVIGSTTAASAYTETFSSAVGILQLSGNIVLTSNMGAIYAENAQFNVTGGVTSLTGTGTTGIVSTTNQTGSTSTIGVSAGTLQWVNATGLSGLSSTGSNVVSCSGTGVIGYAGAAQTVYTDLPVTGLPTGVSYEGISFSGTGIKTPNGNSANNLNIAGSFTNLMPNTAGNYVSLYNTIVNFNGATAQALAGGTASPTYGSVFKTVNFSNAGAKTMSGNFYVAPTGVLSMSNSATLVAGDNAAAPTTADAYLNLVCDVDSAAAVAQIPAGCSISGNVNVQRYISGERGYRLLSSPVNAGPASGGTFSMNYLLNYMYLTGSGTGFTANGNSTLFLYDEGFVPAYLTYDDSNFIAISSMSYGTGTSPTYPINVNGAGLTGSYSVPVGNGFYAFYRGNLSEGTTDLTTPSYTGVLPSTITATGTLNQGQVAFKNWYTPSSVYLGGVSQYYNLIGNPYASAIDLATVQGTTMSSGIYMTPYYAGATPPSTSDGISHFVYELNPVTNIYAIYNLANPTLSTNNASEFIASGQAFFVQAYGANTSQLVINESAKAGTTNANAPGFMSRKVNNLAGIITNSPNAVLRLKMSLDTINNEETVITFNPKASNAYVINEDAPHRQGEGLVGFTSISSDNVPLGINMLPLAATQTIPLRTVATNDGLYNITLTQLAQLPALYEIWLKDAYKKDSLDIKDNPIYNFDIVHADTSTFGNYRFTLVIRQNPALMVHLLSFTALKATGGDNVAWTTENEANYTSFAVQRSTNGGQTFTTLDSLESSGLGAYNYLDSKPAEGANSYRLQLTDLNGNITYSNVITIMYANTGNQIALNGFMVYPNPTAGPVNLSITQPATSSGNGVTAAASLSTNYTIQIVNNLGVVLKTAQSSSPQWQTDVSALVPGTYFITVMNSTTNTVVGKSAFVKL